MAQFVKGQPRLPGAGRKKGSMNKVPKEAREAIQDVVDGNSEKLQGWLDQVAQNDPVKAIELHLKMLEFVAPKLSRTEHTGGLAHLSISAILDNVMGKTTGLPDPAWFEVVDGVEGGREKSEIIDI